MMQVPVALNEGDDQIWHRGSNGKALVAGLKIFQTELGGITIRGSSGNTACLGPDAKVYVFKDHYVKTV